MTEIEKRMQNLKAIQAAVNGKSAQEVRNIAQGVETRADEAMHTTNTGYGEEYVASDLATTVLEKVRGQSDLMEAFPAPIAMPTAIYRLPVEGSDPTWFATGETTDCPTAEFPNSKAGTSELVLTAKKYSTMVYASAELDEDSVVNIRSYLSDKMAKSYKELREAAWINGDTDVTAANVNTDVAPAAGSYYLHQDGIMKAGISGGAATSVDVGVLDVQDIRAARGLMGIKGTRPENLALLIDVQTYQQLLGLGQVETIEKFGSSATIVNGVLSAIDGIKVLPFGGNILSTGLADGTVSATPTNNTFGRASLVYTPDMISGYKRQLQVYTEFLPQYDKYRFTAHARFALSIKEADSAIALYNISI